MIGLVHARFNTTVAVASGIAVTFGLMTIPPEPHGHANVRSEAAAIQLAAVISTQLAALENNAPTSIALSELEPHTTTLSALAPTAAATAAATGGDILASLRRGLTNIIRAVAAPLWWLGLPITYQLYLNQRRQAAAPATYIPTVFDALGWFLAPLNFGSAAVPTSAPASAASITDPPSASASENTSASYADPMTAAAHSATNTSHAGTAAAVASETGASTVLRSLAIGALAAVATPFWYIGFPVTLPLSIAAGIGLINFVNLLPLGFGLGGAAGPLAGAVIGLGIFALGPLAVIGQSLASIATAFSPSTPSATSAARTAQRAATTPIAAATATEGGASTPAVAAATGPKSSTSIPVVAAATGRDKRVATSTRNQARPQAITPAAPEAHASAATTANAPVREHRSKSATQRDRQGANP